MVAFVFQMTLVPKVVVTIPRLLAGYSDAITSVCARLPDQKFLCYSDKNIFNKEHNVRVALHLVILIW